MEYYVCCRELAQQLDEYYIKGDSDRFYEVSQSFTVQVEVWQYFNHVCNFEIFNSYGSHYLINMKTLLAIPIKICWCWSISNWWSTLPSSSYWRQMKSRRRSTWTNLRDSFKRKAVSTPSTRNWLRISPYLTFLTIRSISSSPIFKRYQFCS